jgi:hypothetical protein
MGTIIFFVTVSASSALVFSWIYFRRYQINRPPIGVFNIRDISWMVGGIILIPYIYMLVPKWLVAGLLLIVNLLFVNTTLEPILHLRWLIWPISLGLIGMDVWFANRFAIDSNMFYLINNCVLVITVIGISNMWAQSGMKARDAMFLAAFLTIYDLTATSLLPIMSELFTRLAELPFFPAIAWRKEDVGLAIGLGDLLIASLFPLVMRKAFGKWAGRIALAICLAVIGLMLMLPLIYPQGAMFPAMVVLGPLMILQYFVWYRRFRKERTTWQYLESEPLTLSNTGAP